jgi:hypothetical protein
VRVGGYSPRREPHSRSCRSRRRFYYRRRRGVEIPNCLLLSLFLPAGAGAGTVGVVVGFLLLYEYKTTSSAAVAGSFFSPRLARSPPGGLSRCTFHWSSAGRSQLRWNWNTSTCRTWPAGRRASHLAVLPQFHFILCHPIYVHIYVYLSWKSHTTYCFSVISPSKSYVLMIFPMSSKEMLDFPIGCSTGES